MRNGGGSMISQRGRGRTIKGVGNLQLSHNFLKSAQNEENWTEKNHNECSEHSSKDVII